MEIPGNEFRIKNKTIQDRVKVGGNPGVKKTEDVSTGKTGGTENVNVSSQAKDIQAALQAARSAPDIRVEKVERIKQLIAQGKFHVDSRDLAEKILKDIISESKFPG
ncbi:MAG: flagellar biosynthesis anti-sigma factor FlgM [Nitrospinae bacterium CG11_big_fil_rev_8_21_14_0_20_56_8]|nr:MAG: flagellar biosynthesis anti-sigma factor FlgM [Nitrospinae bacterium CG11_big_fil_rev_8_21_14_0_20_56_8]